MKVRNPSPEIMLSTNQVAEKFKLSLRQLQWWDERRVIHPRHEAHRRIYNRQDVRLIAVVSALRACGCSLQTIRRILSYTQYRNRLMNNPLSIVMVTAMGVIHIRDSWDEFELLVKRGAKNVTVAVVNHA